MLRISTNESEGRVVTLRLEGQIVGAWIPELHEACKRMLAAGHQIILDLEDVSLIDRRGTYAPRLPFTGSSRAGTLLVLPRGATSIGIVVPIRKDALIAMNRLQTLPAASSESAPQADPNRWVDDHGDCLFRYALIRVRNQEVAEDLVQESMLAAMRQIEKFDLVREKLALRHSEEQCLRLFPKARARNELYRP